MIIKTIPGVQCTEYGFKRRDIPRFFVQSLSVFVSV